MEAGQLWQRRGKHPDLVKQRMMTDMLKYRLHEAPYTSLPTDGELSTLKLYWQNISKDDDQVQLPWLALLLLDIKPHAADPEKTFSLMGWIHSARRSQLASKTTIALAMIKMSYNSQKAKDRQVTPQLTFHNKCNTVFLFMLIHLMCIWFTHCGGVGLAFTTNKHIILLCSAPKPIRELDMIMQKEQLAAGVVKKVTTEAITAAVEASTQIDLTATTASTTAEQQGPEALAEQLQDMSAVSPSEEVELACTDEVLDLFSGYYDADQADAQNKNVAKDGINTNLDFNSKVFEPNYVSQPAPSPLEHTQGSHTASFDVRQFVARC